VKRTGKDILSGCRVEAGLNRNRLEFAKSVIEVVAKCEHFM
jgi:hypothetical protein